MQELGAALAAGFRLDRELAPGGMSQVFIAHDLDPLSTHRSPPSFRQDDSRPVTARIPRTDIDKPLAVPVAPIHTEAGCTA